MFPEGPPIPVADPHPEARRSTDVDLPMLILIWLGPVAIMVLGFAFGTFFGGPDNAIPLDWDYLGFAGVLSALLAVVGLLVGLPGFLGLRYGSTNDRRGLLVVGAIWMVATYLAAVAMATFTFGLAVFIRTPFEGDYA